MHSAFPRIAVVGGGISGLAAAHRVTELLPRAELSLYEAADRLGGVVRTIHHDGCLVEQAADSFITKLPWAIDLCRRLGISDDLLSTNAAKRRAYVVRDGRLLPVPDGFVLMTPRKLWPILTSPVLSWRGKLRLLAEPLILDRQNFANDDARASNDESVASFATRRLGREVFERLVQPLLVGIYTADPAKLSISATLPDILRQYRAYGRLILAGKGQSPPTGTLSDEGNEPATAESGARYGLFVAPKNGMSSLVERLADRLLDRTIHLNSPIARIDRGEEGGWNLSYLDQANPERFDAVIVALPAPSAGRLLRDCDPELAAELGQIEYAGCAVVSCCYRREQLANLPSGFGFVVPIVARRRILAASFASEKFPQRAPNDQIIVRAFLGGALDPRIMERSDSELGAIAMAELADLLEITGQPLWTDVAKWPGSMPQYHVGHLDRVASIEVRVAELPSLELAGNAYHGVGIPQCIHSGELAAERIAGCLTD
jgi:protoporphyrinogen/coproporphyrinogen III oxidase